MLTYEFNSHWQIPIRSESLQTKKVVRWSSYPGLISESLILLLI